jgi:tetratricopeptide (TPR) repeat protein
MATHERRVTSLPGRGWCPTTAVRAVAMVALAVSIRPDFAAAQSGERDTLLNCFYEARASRPEDARSCLLRLLATQPADVQALTELGYFELAQRREEAAIDAFNRAIASGSGRADVRAQLGYLYLSRHERERALENFQAALTVEPANDRVRMQTAYLLDDLGREREAKRLFDLVEKETSDEALRRQACVASEVLAPLAMRRLRQPYYVDIYTAPDWHSGIDVATLPLRLRSGVAVGPGDRIEIFSQAAMLADNKSDPSDQLGPVIYFDNVLTLGGGVSVQPFAGIGLTISTEIGAAYDLVDQGRPPWRFDNRTGIQYYGTWQTSSGCPPGLSVPMRPVLEVYGTAFYLSRYENTIGSLRLRPGLRLLETARTSLDINLHLAGVVDTEGEDFNNLFEIGGGAIFTPDRRIGFRVGVETVRRQFRGGDHDVVTRLRLEYAARF